MSEMDETTAAAIRETFDPASAERILDDEAAGALAYRLTQAAAEHDTTPRAILAGLRPDDRAYAPSADHPAALLAARVRDGEYVLTPTGQPATVQDEAAETFTVWALDHNPDAEPQRWGPAIVDRLAALEAYVAAWWWAGREAWITDATGRRVPARQLVDDLLAEAATADLVTVTADEIVDLIETKHATNGPDENAGDADDHNAGYRWYDLFGGPVPAPVADEITRRWGRHVATRVLAEARHDPEPATPAGLPQRYRFEVTADRAQTLPAAGEVRVTVASGEIWCPDPQAAADALLPAFTTATARRGLMVTLIEADADPATTIGAAAVAYHAEPAEPENPATVTDPKDAR